MAQTLTHTAARRWPPLHRFLAHRRRSDRPSTPPPPPPDADTDPSPSPPQSEMPPGLRRLEEAIYGIIVRRAAPDWLPFVPGASYWVPPRKRSHGMVQLVQRIGSPLTREEVMSFTTDRGWPSSSYFGEGAVPHEVKNSPEKVSTNTEDEES